MIGEMVSHYRVVEKLGGGGMGVVYRGEDLKLQRPVALKFLPPEWSRDGDAKQRFLHEARAASALDHPNICTVYEIGETDDGRLFLAMACYEGETLQQRIDRDPLPVAEVVDIAQQVAAGLAQAHEQGIVHRDIKPANVMLTAAGVVKILDFGLAKLAGRTKLTKTGSTLGTVAYMAPEQARGGEVDGRSDLWSLGAMLYEMLSGRPPFSGDYEQSLIYAILHQEPEPVSALRPEVPAALDRVVKRLLTKEPSKRYQRADEVLADLEGVSATPTTEVLERPAQGELSQRRLWPAWAAVGVVVLLALAGALYWVARREGASPTEAPPRIRSLAVLPFDNLMNDPEQDYFVEGMHEALITDLSKVGSLRVISRTSAMRYQESGKPMPEIARELDVDALVEGSVLRVGDEVRITAQLIHGSSDRHLWADSYDRQLEDVLGLLTEVARAIAGEIEGTLSPNQRRRLVPPAPVSREAQEFYLKGRYHSNRLVGGGLEKGLELLQKTIELDPEFAPAHAALAVDHFLMGLLGREPMADVAPKARAAANRALELDEGSSGAHSALGWIRLYADWDWAGAEAEFRRALQLNPSNAYAYHGLGDYLVVMGRVEESLEQVQKGRQCDPISPHTVGPFVGHLVFARRYGEAIAEARHLLEMDPEFPVRSFLRAALWHQGRYEEALEEYRLAWEERWPEALAALERGYAEAGPGGAMRALAEHATQQPGGWRSLEIASLYARAGAVDEALRWLEQAYQERQPTLVHLRADPDFDPVRSDPRFHELLRQIGFPES